MYLPGGKLLYAAGTKVNPLDHMEWEGKLVFIDAKDKEQIAWVKKNHIDMSEIDVDDAKIVLVAGKPLELEKETGKNIYFDQFGELTSKFNISHVPAVVEQEDKHLKVTEVYIGESK